MIKGRYVATLIIDIHIDRKGADVEMIKGSLNGEFTKQLRDEISNGFCDGDVDVTLVPQFSDVYGVKENETD